MRAQRLARVAAPEAVRAQDRVRPIDPPRDHVGNRLEVVGRRHDRSIHRCQRLAQV